MTIFSVPSALVPRKTLRVPGTSGKYGLSTVVGVGKSAAVMATVYSPAAAAPSRGHRGGVHLHRCARSQPPRRGEQQVVQVDRPARGCRAPLVGAGEHQQVRHQPLDAQALGEHGPGQFGDGAAVGMGDRQLRLASTGRGARPAVRLRA